jgi:hypothetical protein
MSTLFTTIAMFNLIIYSSGVELHVEDHSLQHRYGLSHLPQETGLGGPVDEIIASNHQID